MLVCVCIYRRAETHSPDIPVLVIAPLIAPRHRELAYKLYNKEYYPGW